MSDATSEGSVPSVTDRGDGSATACGGIRARMKATRLDYHFTDESGYRFDVAAALDDEWGWSASVTLSVHGIKTAEGAVEYLLHPARHFIRMVDDARTDAAQPEPGPLTRRERHPPEASEVTSPNVNDGRGGVHGGGGREP